MNILTSWAAELAALILITILTIGSLAVAAVSEWWAVIVGLAAAGFVIGFVYRVRRAPAAGRHHRGAVAVIADDLADDDALVERIRRGEAPDGPLEAVLGAWRDEVQR